MKQILVYADSLSWGIVPDARNRFSFDQRWPGVMELELIKQGQSVRVIEDCLNGRRTVWNDPFKPGRNGLLGLEQRIEINSPLALVIIFLGTNDFQAVHQNNVWQSSQGISTLVSAIRRAPIESGMPIPEILIVAPPAIEKAKGDIAPKFEGAEARIKGVSEEYEKVAKEMGCHFFDVGSVTSSSKVDGVHLDEDQHLVLGKALSQVVGALI